MSIRVNKLHTYTGHRDCVYALSTGDAPHEFYSAGGDGMVVQWNMQHPDQGELMAHLPHAVYALAYWAERQLLVAGHNTEGIHLLDVKQRKEVSSLKLGPAAVFAIAIHQSEAWVACGDGAVSVVDLDTMTIRHRLILSDKSARAVALHPSGGQVAVGYSDHFIRVFDRAEGKLICAWKAHQNSVFTLGYTADGQFLLSGGRDARLMAWDTRQKYQLNQEVVAHLFAINSLDFSPDGKHFVTCSLDKSIKVWRTADLTLLKVIDKARHAGHGTSVNKVLWTTFQGQVLSASDDRTISGWDVIF